VRSSFFVRLATCGLLALVAAPAAARIKIDRYEAAALPKVKLWVTLLDGTRPPTPGIIQTFSVQANGRHLREGLDWEQAGNRGDPMAIGVVVDARYAENWRAVRGAVGAFFTDLPSDSLGFISVTGDEEGDFPPLKEGFTDDPATLPSNVKDLEGGSSQIRFYGGIMRALQRFPLAPGLEPEKDDGALPKELEPGAPPFPLDRVLVVVGDGEMKQSRGDQADRRSQRLRTLVRHARRRGVRVMTIGLIREETEHLWTLRVLARKTGGTYRRMPGKIDAERTSNEVMEELRQRYIIEIEHPQARRGDSINFTVKAFLLRAGKKSSESTREYEARIKNELTFFGRVSDWISDTWEGLPWWLRLLIMVLGAVIVLLIVIIKIVRGRRSAGAAEDAAMAARQADLAARKPCPVCGNKMMPDWTECLFCARTKAVEEAMRFRLIVRAGYLAGESYRFGKELVTVGSGSHCDVVVEERGVDPEHFTIRDRGGESFSITDFNTDDGTWVNGEQVNPVADLYEGDVIRVAETEFIFGIET
jgi:hypothetical protein